MTHNEPMEVLKVADSRYTAAFFPESGVVELNRRHETVMDEFVADAAEAQRWVDAIDLEALTESLTSQDDGL